MKSINGYILLEVENQELTSMGGIIIPESAKTNDCKIATVVGDFEKDYNDFGQSTQINHLKLGDKVLIPNKANLGYEVTYNGVDCLAIKASEIILVFTK
jgi:co-chaperonin GroES (HSP10)